MVEMKVALDNIANNFELGVPGEGHLARQHDVEDYSQRPNVNLGVIVLQEDFWGDIVRLYWEKEKVCVRKIRVLKRNV